MIQILQQFSDWLVSVIVFLFEREGDCRVFSRFHLYCPGCGGTRALIALARFNIIQSLRYNPFILILIVYNLLFFIQLFTKRKFVTNKTAFTIIGLWALYSIIRNIFLVYFGIDWLS